MKGTVTLIGAGPGDPGLLTLRGREVLSQAEVVVYDRLINLDLLKWAAPDAKLIDVGKNAGYHPVPQEQINRILLEEAEKGLRVVRLKGGDPYVFGRGAEELELLMQSGIEFEVVPGVTSALSVPAYAGIPATDRDSASSVHIIAGRLRGGRPPSLDYEALVRTGGTLIFMMGVATLPVLCEELLKAGLAPDLPAAIVENGTFPTQRKVLATAGTLAARARAEKIRSPAISVFGNVCRFSEALDWQARRPLKGKTVLVTRPAVRNGELVHRLGVLGAEVIAYPCIETLPRADQTALRAAIEALEAFRGLVFTSPAGPAFFFPALFESGRDVRALGGLKLAAIGPKTAEALSQYGLHADLLPEVYDSAHLAQVLCQDGTGPLLLCRSSAGSAELPARLREKGIPFSDIPCYDTVYRKPDSAPVLRAMERGRVYVTFTSASTVRGFMESLPAGTDCTGLLGCCIGETTRHAAESYGLQTITAEQATVESLIDRIVEEAKKS